MPRKCRCRNHKGGLKIMHRSQDAALHWILVRGLTGVAYETYPCPDTDRWHVRTKRERREMS